jgi:hypothetical protein
MGQEIAQTSFAPEDAARFAERLKHETQLVQDTFVRGGFAARATVAGYELEAWLLDRNFYPVPCNQSFLARMDDPMVVAELSRFNIELNGPPQALTGPALSTLERALSDTWSRCVATAHADEATAIAIGTLPTLRDADLSVATMTPSNRYVALNRQVLKARGGKPISLDIEGLPGSDQHLRTAHADVMLEAATTSFQLHLQVPAARVSAHMNASMMLSGPLVALSANSPFLFGRTLWHETRIPLFEQAVDSGVDPTVPGRVDFGPGYLDDDPTGYFADNTGRFGVLLPLCEDSPPEDFTHLRLHNGTVWRWNRLLIGFDTQREPHLRIEQRAMPAGPSIIDMMANAAFYYGAVHALAQWPDATSRLPFARARNNFYRAARLGLDAPLHWLDGGEHDAADLLQNLLPMAREGLQDLGIDVSDIDRYLDVLSMRLRHRCNGATWQRRHHARHGDFFRLTADYLANQRGGRPVHEWPA